MARKAFHRELRPPDAAAVARFGKALAAAARSDVSRFNAVLDSVGACFELIMASDDWNRAGYVGPIFDLLTELVALGDGAPSFMFLPDPIHSRPRQHWVKESERALAVAAAEALSERGDLEMAAALKVVSHWMQKIGRTSVTPKKIMAWRREFRRSSAKRYGAAEYRRYKPLCLEFFHRGHGKTEAIRRLKAGVNRSVAMRPRKAAESDPL